jgi:KipI family sensor histidine kinase inhibitor
VRVEALGEAAFILRDFDLEPHELARSIEASQLPGVEEVVTSISTVGLYVDPDRFRAESLRHLQPVEGYTSHHFFVPVMFNGEDLAHIAKQLMLEPEAVISLFCTAIYTVASIGFLPGFPYLNGLPAELQSIGRRAEPRITVPKGSVAIGAGKAGIYPQESPGGWQLLGTTPFEIANVQQGYFPLSPGDTITFEPIDEASFATLNGRILTFDEDH